MFSDFSGEKQIISEVASVQLEALYGFGGWTREAVAVKTSVSATSCGYKLEENEVSGVLCFGFVVSIVALEKMLGLDSSFSRWTIERA